MDRHFTGYQTEGVASLVLLFNAFNYPLGPRRIRRMLKIMHHQTIYPRKNVSKQGTKEFIKPFLFNGLQIPPGWLRLFRVRVLPDLFLQNPNMIIFITQAHLLQSEQLNRSNEIGLLLLVKNH